MDCADLEDHEGCIFLGLPWITSSAVQESKETLRLSPCLPPQAQLPSPDDTKPLTWDSGQKSQLTLNVAVTDGPVIGRYQGDTLWS